MIGAQTDLFTQLVEASDESCFYWADKEGRERVIGIGCAWQGSDLSQAPAGARVYGGMRFDPRAPSLSPEWQPFGTSWWCVPRISYSESNGTATLSHSDGSTASIVSITERPDQATWEKQVRRALGSSFDKLVLARTVDVLFDQPPVAAELLRSLAMAAPGCYHFLIQPRPGHAFFGSSPERLFRISKRQLLTEAVAGTRPAGRQQGEELLKSEKDRREHQLVVQRICAQLGPLADSIDHAAVPGLLERRYWQHLWTPITAILKSSTTVNDLIAALHPTPAVGGEPRAGAEAAIAAIEGFDRGWYAGLVGWVQGEEAELAVGIRSGLLTDRMLRLYTGCGIVQGSDPAEEWEETRLKVAGFLAALPGGKVKSEGTHNR